MGWDNDIKENSNFHDAQALPSLILTYGASLKYMLHLIFQEISEHKRSMYIQSYFQIK